MQQLKDMFQNINAAENEEPILDCTAYEGGPSTKHASEMIYWNENYIDRMSKSPFYKPNQYLTFEPDPAGWNNIRLGLETSIALAFAMGRTLVIPPPKSIWNLGKSKKGSQKNLFSILDFFAIDSTKLKGIDIISMEEFLVNVAMKGELYNRSHAELIDDDEEADTAKPCFPPNNVTDWSDKDDGELEELWDYLRNVTHVADWNPDDCIAVFPSGPHKSDEDNDEFRLELEAVLRNYQNLSNEELNAKNIFPVAVDAPPSERILEIATNREDICFYDNELQAQPYFHLIAKEPGIRYLIQYYAFLFFEDWERDLSLKRLMRDHVRYRDEIQCAAARIVQALHERARLRNTTNTLGTFDTMHVRRGDFQEQFDETDGSAKNILSRMKKIIKPGQTVFIATDVKNKDSFFKLFRKHYDIVFLNDFNYLIEALNSNYYAMLDQLVASKGDKFIGTYFSTFSGYIVRLRGFAYNKLQLEGYQKGNLMNTFYYPKTYERIMHYYQPVYYITFSQEFPVAWRDIDYGFDELVSLNDKKYTFY